MRLWGAQEGRGGLERGLHFDRAAASRSSDAAGRRGQLGR